MVTQLIHVALRYIAAGRKRLGCAEYGREQLQLSVYSLWCRIRGKVFDTSPYIGRAEAGFVYRTTRSIPALSITLFKHRLWITLPTVLECKRTEEKSVLRERGADGTLCESAPSQFCEEVGMNEKDDYQRLLAKHLARNEKVWPALQKSGISDTGRLRLDFYYFASSEARAQQLILFLRGETDYEVELRSEFSTEGEWLIAGRTQETTVSREILDHWVGWMAAAGFARDCAFGGWGVSVEQS